MKIHPIITTVSLTSAGEEYSFTIPAGATGYSIKLRGNHEFKLAYKAGDIAAGNYLTIPSGNAETEDDLSRSDPLKGYIQSEVDSETLEVKYWRN